MTHEVPADEAGKMIAAGTQQLPKAPLAECEFCPLRSRPFVPSTLPATAKVLFVGEAPGATEVAEHKPFVGDAGKLLRQGLANVGIDPGTAAYTNAVLCRPEGNATPDPMAVECCSKRLRQEIAASGARVTVALGNTAIQALDGLAIENGDARVGYSGGVMSRRGLWYPLGRSYYLAALHPAAILRSPNLATLFVEDMKKAARAVQGMRREPYNVDKLKYIVAGHHNAQRVLEYLQRIDANTVVGFDVETTGFNWYDTPSKDAARLLAVGISYESYRSAVFPADYLLSVDGAPVYYALEGALKRCKALAHNGKFDQQHLLTHGLAPALAHDTMLASYGLDEVGTHKLKDLIRIKLECADDYEARLIDAWFDQNKIKKEDRTYDKLPPANLYEYLAIDCNAMLALHHALYAELEAEQLVQWPYTNVLMRASNAITQVEINGIKVDVPYLHEVRAYTAQKIAELLDVLQAMVSEHTQAWLEKGGIRVPKAAWIKDRETYARCITKLRDGFLPSSWQQVQVFMYDVLGLKHSVSLSYKTDKRSTNDEALTSLKPNDTIGFIALLVEYRRLLKIQSTYIDNLLALADANDRVHINFKLHGTEVGRLSATDGLHGIPRPSDIYGKAIRGSFIAAPGCKLVVADFSQAELRVFAAETLEPTMLEPYRRGDDLHDETAVMIAPALAAVFAHHFLHDHNGDWLATKECTICKEIRTLAKNVNFGEIYQGGAAGIAAMLGGVIPYAVVAEILRIKREKQQTAAAWKAQQLRIAKTQGYVQSRFGYKRRFPVITDDTLDEVKKSAVHMPVANGAAVLTLLSICDLVEQGVMVCGTWHDSIIAEAPEILAEQTAQLMQQVMQHNGEHYYPELPWKVDIDIVDRWYPTPPSFKQAQTDS